MIPDHVGISGEELRRLTECARIQLLTLHSKWAVKLQQTDAWSSGSQTVVWGAGDKRARCLVVGEAPGELEVATGAPLVGPAGQCLSDAFTKVGIDRSKDVFITNTVCLAPARDRRGKIGKPTPFDLMLERERVEDLFDLIQPKVVLLLGKFAYLQAARPELLAQMVREDKQVEDQSFFLSQFLGVHRQGLGLFDCPVVVAYHPSYILRLVSRNGEMAKDELLQYLGLMRTLKELIHA